MKQFILLSLSFFLTITIVNAQDFDAQLEELAQNIATKLDGKGKKKVAVWGFVTESGERTALGNYLTEDFSVYVTNFGDNFEIIDRNHLDMLLKEHQLNSEGYIDETTAKELGKIVAVDAIITGTFTVLTTSVKVRAKVLDTETALQFAASMSNLPLDENVASYLGISVNGGNTTNKGFNRPLGSNETMNNPDTVDSKCSEEDFGDFCFLNSKTEKVAIKIRDTKNRLTTIFLESGESKCIYSLKSGVVEYDIVTWPVLQKELEGNIGKIGFASSTKYSFDRGQLKVETCKSKTYTIK